MAKINFNRATDTSLRKWLERVDGRFMGVPANVNPHEAILHAMQLAAGEMMYCDAQIARLSEDEIFERPRESRWVEIGGKTQEISETRSPEQMSRWVAWRRDAADRMAKYAKMAIDVGIEEHKVRLAEQQATLVSKYLEAVIGDVGLSPDQARKLGPALRQHMPMLELEVS